MLQFCQLLTNALQFQSHHSAVGAVWLAMLVTKQMQDSDFKIAGRTRCLGVAYQVMTLDTEMP